ncbi:putative agmatine N(4)-coumaroyltransferase [Arabidopsis thaliana]
MSLYQNGEFSMSARRDEIGGVEISICLKKCEMNVFRWHFCGNMGLSMVSRF